MYRKSSCNSGTVLGLVHVWRTKLSFFSLTDKGLITFLTLCLTIIILRRSYTYIYLESLFIFHYQISTFPDFEVTQTHKNATPLSSSNLSDRQGLGMPCQWFKFCIFEQKFTCKSRGHKMTSAVSCEQLCEVTTFASPPKIFPYPRRLRIVLFTLDWGYLHTSLNPVPLKS